MSFAGCRPLEAAGLHHGGVQVEVVRHHRRAENADGDVQHIWIGDDLGHRHEAREDVADGGLRHCDLDEEAAGDDQQQAEDESFQVAEAPLLQEKNDQDVQRGQADAPHQRDAEEQLQRDGRADHLGEVAGDNRQFTEYPQGEGDRWGIVVMAGLREVSPGRHAELHRQRLQQNRQNVRQQNDGQQRVPERRAAGDVGGPVAWIDVADGDQVSGPGEGEHTSPYRSAGDGHTSVHLRQTRRQHGGSPGKPA